MVLFAHHNVIKDPPFSHLDLISCRNLLIYLNRAAQERVVETFHFALRPGGYLFLGTSESPDGAATCSCASTRTAHIYQSRTVTSRLALPLTERPGHDCRGTPTRHAEPRRPNRSSPADLHHRLLERVRAAVGGRHRGAPHRPHVGARRPLPADRGGEPSRDLLRLVQPELRLDCAQRCTRPRDERTKRRGRGHRRCRSRTATARVDLTVRPVLRDDDPARGFFLVLFDERDERRPMPRPPSAR